MTNRSKPAGTIFPSLIYRDLGKAIDWLSGVFGFTERLRVTDSEGKVGHAQLAIGQGGILLGEPRTGPDGIVYRPPRPNEVTQTVTVSVEDVDRHYEHAKRRGAQILQPPTTHPYGERQYSALDPEGHRWAFSQSVADVTPENWGAVASDLGYEAAQPRPRWCYIEIPALDVHQSAAFYEAVFGWNIRHRESGRPAFDDATGNVSGAWVTCRPPSREPGLLPYIWVDSIDGTLAAVKAHGGEVVDTQHLDSPGGEYIATFRDPAGNLIGLYQTRSR